ncbi:MAG: hypothetical protein E7G12_10605, partial [Klebsiella michiganensis]|nr:hypothetical protein [Klebsiella michiganensis]
EDGTVARFENEKRQDARQRQGVARGVLGALPFDSLRAALNQVREAVEYEQYR